MPQREDLVHLFFPQGKTILREMGTPGLQVFPGRGAGGRLMGTGAEYLGGCVGLGGVVWRWCVLCTGSSVVPYSPLPVALEVGVIVSILQPWPQAPSQ